MKKTIYILLFLSLIALRSYCQNGVSINISGNKPDTSAMLDVSSTNKGILIPRLAINITSSAAPVILPQASLLVYNTATINDVIPGYYYWDGLKWVRLSTGTGSGGGWSLTGNTGTVDGINFIGTTDNNPFNIRVNNQKAGRIDFANTFYGCQAGNSNTGMSNTAIGAQALYSNNIGYSNTANGNMALCNNITGNYNTANGNWSLASNTTGSNNTAIGNGADVSAVNLSNATAIGYNASVATSNSVVLGNGANVGIGTSAPDTKLHLVGNIKMVDGNQAAGKILTSDANGVGSWQASSSAAPYRALYYFDMANSNKFWNYSSTGGTVNYSWDGAAIDCGTNTAGVAGMCARTGVWTNNAYLFKGKPTFSVTFVINQVGSTDGQEGFLGVCSSPLSGATGMQWTHHHIGFRLVRTGGSYNLQATVSNGTQSTVTLLTGLATQDLIEAIFKVTSDGNSVDFYTRKNGGALSSATTINTNVPSDDAAWWEFGFTNASVAPGIALTLYINSAYYERNDK